MTEPRQRIRPEDPPLNGGEPPPAWDVPPPRSGPFDLRPLFVLLDALRRGLPDGVREQFTVLVRELLLTLRALIDWYLERLDRRPREPRVEEIRIE
jgi:hypothetical protein